MTYAGNFALGETINIKFTTVNTSGVPTTLAGTPVVSAYPGSSTTQVTAGITLTVDFDGVTGLHNVAVVATLANGYLTRTDYTLVITTGTVGGSSVVGYVVGSFSIGNRVTNTILSGLATAATATSVTLPAAASTTANLYNGALIHVLSGTGAGQQRSITAYSTGRVATVDTWATTPDTTSQLVLLPGSSSWEGEAGPTADEIGDDIAARTLSANVVSIASDAITAAALADDATAAVGTGVWNEVLAEPAGVFNWATTRNTFRDLLQWVGAFARNEVRQTATTQSLRNDANNANLGTATVSDDGTTGTRGEWT